MAEKIKENNTKNNITSFILPVGPKGQYKRFARICNLERINCKNLITINMDEYLENNGSYIKESSPLSFRGFMNNNLFNLLDDELKIKPENIYFPNPNNTGEIEKLINEIGGVDICFGGVGINGHIAFNEPMDEKTISKDEFRNLKTRILELDRDTILISSMKYGGYFEYNWQSTVLRKAIFLDSTPSFPISFLKEHHNSSITISNNVLKNYMY
jgi:glucosamine-6-phosphate deaminase